MPEKDGAVAALRAGTAADHERLDGLFARFDLADPAGYRAFLTAHARALPAVEHALDEAGFAGELPDWNERKRTTALEADLIGLGRLSIDPGQSPFVPSAVEGSPSAAEAPPAIRISTSLDAENPSTTLGANGLDLEPCAVDAELPTPLPFAIPADPAAAWGAAYVIEGSRLGGKFLSQQVGETLPKAYLATPQAPGAWRSFLHSLEEHVRTPDEIAAAVAAANAVFALFERAGREQIEQLDR